MARPILPEDQIHPAIRQRVATLNADIVDEVRRATARSPIVVVGMAQNPFPKKARRALDKRGLAHEYLQYGSYFSGWRRRNALKMWTGWPTFPMVFVQGVLVGGASELAALIESGSLDALRR